MKRMNIVVVDGRERDVKTLSKEKQEKLTEEWNRRALEAIGYRRVNNV